MPLRPTVFSIFLFPILLILLCASPTRAQGTWNLTTADFRSEAVILNSLDSTGLRVAPLSGGEARLVPFDHFLELTRALSSSQPLGKFTLHMIGGDRLGGEPLAIKGNSLLWNSAAVGEVPIPMKRLAALTQGNKPLPERGRQDVVTLSNGDVLKGIIASLGDGKVSIQTDAGPSDAPLASVASISFAATGGSGSAEKSFRVRFDDGSSLVVPFVSLAGENFELSFGKDLTRSLPANRVAAIEQVNGPVSWLSTRAPTESIYIPYFGNSSLYPARMNANYRGEEIRFRDQHFSRGIGVHAYSRLAWNLDGAYAAFRGRFAIDGDGQLADVTVRIKLDDKTAFEQEHVRAGVLSPVVLLDLAGAKTLTLEVDFGANGATQDRLNWIEPALLKEKPATESGTDPAR
jgi:hypothetical protein